jgi:hypothetical protein
MYANKERRNYCYGHRRCQAITVSGLTIIRVSRQPSQNFESQTQKRRSIGRSLGRGWRRLKTASCCLRAIFSRARSRFRLKAEKNAEMQAVKPLIISPTILGASREAQCFPRIRTFGDGQVMGNQLGTMCFVSRGCITTLDRIRHWRGTRQLLERLKRQLRARSSQFLKSAGCIIVTDEPHNVGDPVSSREIEQLRLASKRTSQQIPS